MIVMIGVDWLMNGVGKKRKKYDFVIMATAMMRRIELEIVDDLDAELVVL